MAHAAEGNEPMSSGKLRVECLDELRGIAIAMVLLYHGLGACFGLYHLPWNGAVRSFEVDLPFLLLQPLTFGYLGVSVFFVISGFCIHLSFEKGCQRSLPQFAAKRLFRIYPPYLFALLLFSAAWPGHHVFPPSNTADGIQFFSHLLLLHNFTGVTFGGINPSFWSIAVEAQLYACYAVLFLLIGRIGWSRSLIGMFVLEFILRLVSGYIETRYQLVHSPRILSGSPVYFFFSWFCGAYLARLFLAGSLEKSNVFNFTPIPAAVLAVAFDFWRPTSQLTFLFAALATAQVISRTITMAPVCIRWRPLRVCMCGLGVVSYSLYLFHQPVQRLVAKHLPFDATGNLLVVIALLTPLIALASWLSFRLLELPSISLGNKICALMAASRKGVANSAST